MIKVPHPTVLDKLRCPPHPSETEMVVEFPFVTDLQIRLMNLLAHDNRDAVVHLNGVLALAARQGPSFFTVSRVREIGCFWGNPVKSTGDP